MKIDLVRQTPVPPPIDHAVITVSERELRIIATAILRDTYAGMQGSNRLPSSFSEAEWDVIVDKMRTLYP
jgi:hypothetical protein